MLSFLDKYSYKTPQSSPEKVEFWNMKAWPAKNLLVMSHEHLSILNHHQLNCLFYCFLSLTTKHSLKLHITGLCEGNPTVSDGFPLQRANDAESISMWITSNKNYKMNQYCTIVSTSFKPSWRDCANVLHLNAMYLQSLNAETMPILTTTMRTIYPGVLEMSSMC